MPHRLNRHHARHIPTSTPNQGPRGQNHHSRLNRLLHMPNIRVHRTRGGPVGRSTMDRDDEVEEGEVVDDGYDDDDDADNDGGKENGALRIEERRTPSTSSHRQSQTKPLSQRTPVLQNIHHTGSSSSPEQPPPLQTPHRCRQCKQLTLRHKRLVKDMRRWLEQGTSILEAWAEVSETSVTSSSGRRVAVDDTDADGGSNASVTGEQTSKYRPPRHSHSHSHRHHHRKQSHEKQAADHVDGRSGFEDEGIDVMDWEAAPSEQLGNPPPPPYTFAVPGEFSQPSTGCGPMGAIVGAPLGPWLDSGIST